MNGQEDPRFAVIRKRFFRIARFPDGVPLPYPELVPRAGSDDRAEADALRDAVARFELATGSFPAHPFLLGSMTKDEWRRFSLHPRGSSSRLRGAGRVQLTSDRPRPHWLARAPSGPRRSLERMLRSPKFKVATFSRTSTRPTWSTVRRSTPSAWRRSTRATRWRRSTRPTSSAEARRPSPTPGSHPAVRLVARVARILELIVRDDGVLLVLGPGGSVQLGGRLRESRCQLDPGFLRALGRVVRTQLRRGFDVFLCLSLDGLPWRRVLAQFIADQRGQ